MLWVLSRVASLRQVLWWQIVYFGGKIWKIVLWNFSSNRKLCQSWNYLWTWAEKENLFSRILFVTHWMLVLHLIQKGLWLKEKICSHWMGHQNRMWMYLTQKFLPLKSIHQPCHVSWLLYLTIWSPGCDIKKLSIILCFLTPIGCMVSFVGS